jgi:elongation factor G
VLEKGTLSGHPISGVSMALRDEAFHVVDSSELGFRLAAIGMFLESYLKMKPAWKPLILEPIMMEEVVASVEPQSASLSFLSFLAY